MTEPRDSAPERFRAPLRFGIMANTGRNSLDFGHLAIAFGDEMNRILQEVTIKSSISALNAFPSMLESHLFPETVRYHKRSALVSLHFNVPSSRWSELCYAEKVDRLAAKLSENIASIKDDIVSPHDKETLIDAVGSARAKLAGRS